MSLAPKGDKVLLRPAPSEVKTEGKIIQVTKVVPTCAVVVEVSPDIKEPQVSVGDKVQFLPNRRLEEGELFLLSEEDILFKHNA